MKQSFLKGNIYDISERQSEKLNTENPPLNTFHNTIPIKTLLLASSRFDTIEELIESDALTNPNELIVCEFTALHSILNTDTTLKAPILFIDKTLQVNSKDIGLLFNKLKLNQFMFNKIFGILEHQNPKYHLIVVLDESHQNQSETMQEMQHLAKQAQLNNYSINISVNDLIHEGLHHFLKQKNIDILVVDKKEFAQNNIDQIADAAHNNHVCLLLI